MPHRRWPSNVDPVRAELPLAGERRLRAQAECARLAADIGRLDDQLTFIARQRQELQHKLRAVRQRLTVTFTDRGRAPAPDGTERLPPIPAHAVYLRGRRLRGVCLAILAALGPQALPDLHAMLHRAGFAVANDLPVKALADALGYEADGGRARRVSRGVYALVPGTRLPARLWPGGPRLDGTALVV